MAAKWRRLQNAGVTKQMPARLSLNFETGEQDSLKKFQDRQCHDYAKM